MAANEESDPSVILNGFWVTLLFLCILGIILANKAKPPMNPNSGNHTDNSKGAIAK